MPYAESIRVLLDGTCGANHSDIHRVTGVDRKAVIAFMRGEELSDDQMTRLGFFVWDRMNAQVLLCETDGIEPRSRGRAKEITGQERT